MTKDNDETDADRAAARDSDWAAEEHRRDVDEGAAMRDRQAAAEEHRSLIMMKTAFDQREAAFNLACDYAGIEQGSFFGRLSMLQMRIEDRKPAGGSTEPNPDRREINRLDKLVADLRANKQVTVAGPTVIGTVTIGDVIDVRALLEQVRESIRQKLAAFHATAKENGFFNAEVLGSGQVEDLARNVSQSVSGMDVASGIVDHLAAAVAHGVELQRAKSKREVDSALKQAEAWQTIVEDVKRDRDHALIETDRLRADDREHDEVYKRTSDALDQAGVPHGGAELGLAPDSDPLDRLAHRVRWLAKRGQR